MSIADKTLFVCNCNRTMPLDGPALGRALELPAPPQVHTLLCQRELAAFSAGAQGDVLVACTQEQRLLGDVAEEGRRAHEIRFVNIRETGGWSADAPAATPKIAALLAMAALPEPDPVPSVGYRSEGQLLIAGPLGACARVGRRAARAARRHRARDRRRRRRRSCRRSAPIRSIRGA